MTPAYPVPDYEAGITVRHKITQLEGIVTTIYYNLVTVTWDNGRTETLHFSRVEPIG